MSRAAISARSSRRRAALATSSSRWSITRSCSASSRSGRRRRIACSSSGSSRRDRHLPPAADLLRQRAAGDLFLPDPAVGAGGRRAGRLARDGVISLGSLVGFLTVLGIAARNGIMMISHFQHLEREEGEPFGPELVLPGRRERLAPILMTALATGLALVPLVVAGDIPWPRDRAPDGDRDPRRPGHVDAAQPVRSATIDNPWMPLDSRHAVGLGKGRPWSMARPSPIGSSSPSPT